MPKGPKLYTCPKCRHTYLGHDPVPDCPRCGYDYRSNERFRWDMLAYVAAILALLSFFLMTTYYRDSMRMPTQAPRTNENEPEKLPGARPAPFHNPYGERGR